MARLKLPVVAHVFLVRGDVVLLARRANTGFEGGNYGPVGGHLESSKTIFQAAVRKCWEEIGVRPEPSDLKIIGVTHYTSPAGDGINFFYGPNGRRVSLLRRLSATTSASVP